MLDLHVEGLRNLNRFRKINKTGYFTLGIVSERFGILSQSYINRCSHKRIGSPVPLHKGSVRDSLVLVVLDSRTRPGSYASFILFFVLDGQSRPGPCAPFVLVVLDGRT